jgi:hypothetical protein
VSDMATTNGLSPGARKAWRVVVETNGISLTALMEAIGRLFMAEMAAGVDPWHLHPELISSAREIDAQRRRRPKDRRPS